jgi:hypothetical protein
VSIANQGLAVIQPATELDDLVPLNLARLLAILSYLSPRTIDHSTEAECLLQLFSSWPLAAIRYNNRRNSNIAAKSVHYQSRTVDVERGIGGTQRSRGSFASQSGRSWSLHALYTRDFLRERSIYVVCLGGYISAEELDRILTRGPSSVNSGQILERRCSA